MTTKNDSPQPETPAERMDMLRHMIDGATAELAHHQSRVRSLVAELKAYTDELDTLETNAWLTAHNALHLQKGVKLAVCEAFYVLNETDRQANRRQVDGMYGQGAVLGDLDVERGEFRIHAADKGWTIGGIPLEVIQAMYVVANS